MRCSKLIGKTQRWHGLALVVVCALVALGCRQDMHDAPRLEPLEASEFFADGMASRPLPAGTVARGHLREDPRLYEGKDEAGNLIEALPVELELSRELLLRGQQRFEIYCSPCHDSTGGGRGMIVRRGFKQPAPLYEERLVAMPAGYFFDVMTNGFGLMSSYAKQVSVEDRWAIVAYIRALQLRRSLTLDELTPEMRRAFDTALTSPPETEAHAAEAHH